MGAMVKGAHLWGGGTWFLNPPYEILAILKRREQSLLRREGRGPGTAGAEGAPAPLTFANVNVSLNGVEWKDEISAENPSCPCNFAKVPESLREWTLLS